MVQKQTNWKRFSLPLYFLMRVMFINKNCIFKLRMGMKKQLVGLGIIFLLMIAGLSGCTDQETDDDLEDNVGTVENGDESNGNGEIVDDGFLGSVPFIAVDDMNNPHIIMYDTENLDIRYTTRQNGAWQSEIVDSEGNVGDGHDIAIDGDGTPHISYRDITNGGVKYAKKIEHSWDISTIDDPMDEDDSVESSSIAIDSNGNPHVAYNIQSLSTGSYLKYAVWNSSSWDVEILGINGHWVSLALDSNDRPHIAFHDDSESQVCYATKISDSWELTEFDTTTSVGNDPHIAIGSDDYPRIVYRGSSGNCPIKYAIYNGTSWNIETVDEGEQSVDELSFALNDNDIPFIVYGVPSEGLILATIENEEWSYTNLGPARVCSVAVDQLNRAHIAHTYGSDDGEIIKYLLIE
jgi:hypothetical protein